MKTEARSYTKIFVIAISVLTHAAAYIHYVLVKHRIDVLLDGWDQDFAFYVSVSLVLACLSVFIARRRYYSAVLIVRVFILLCICVPFGSYQIITALLLSALFVEITCFFPLGHALISVCFGGAIIFSYQVNSGFVSVLWKPAFLSELFLPAFICLFSLLAGSAIRFLSSRADAQSEHIVRLESSLEKLTAANSEFLRYADNAATDSTLRERKRITRELHDVVGQTFTNVISMIDALLRHSRRDVDSLTRLLRWIRDHTQKGLQETRSVLYELRSIKDRNVTGLKAIKRLAETFEASTGVRVRIEWGNAPWEFDERTDTAIYRVIQEALTNAFRHGRASEISIYFWKHEDGMTIIIQDNGSGTVTAKKGIGQVGMEERISSLGGTLFSGNVTGGYQVRAHIPA